MGSQELHVRNVAGRYGRGRLRSENVEATVSEIGRVFVIRLDDMDNPDAWVEITVEVEVPAPAAVAG